MDVVNVKSKLGSNGYIDKDFAYKRYDLNAISAEQTFEVNVKNEKTLHLGMALPVILSNVT
jgi:hypothetical protein